MSEFKTILETLGGRPLTHEEKRDIIIKKVCDDIQEEYMRRLRWQHPDRYKIDIIYFWKKYDPEMEYFRNGGLY
jgi:hypothetical protein